MSAARRSPPFPHFDKKKKIWGSKKKSGGINFFSEKISDFLKKSWKKNLGSKKKSGGIKIFLGKIPDFLTKIRLFKYCSNIVQIWPSNIVLQILSFKYCSSNIVQKGTPLKILCINSNAGHSSSVVSLLSPRVKNCVIEAILLFENWTKIDTTKLTLAF